MTSTTTSFESKLADALALKEPAQRGEMLDKAVQGHETEGTACREVALMLFNAGDYRLALDFQIRAVNSHVPSGKHNANDENLLALLLMQINDLPSASKVLERMVGEWPNNPAILMNLAVVRKNLGDHAGAIKYAKQVIVVDADNINAHDVLANSYGARGQHDKAVEAGRCALALKDKKYSTTINTPLQKPSFFNPDTPTRNIISFSLWGGHTFRSSHGMIDRKPR